MLEALKWLNVEQRLQYNLCCQMSKIIYKQAPRYLDYVTTEAKSVHRHNTRSASRNDIYVTHSHKNSLKANGTKTWNSLPPNIRDCDNYYSFKKLLVGHLHRVMD